MAVNQTKPNRLPSKTAFMAVIMVTMLTIPVAILPADHNKTDSYLYACVRCENLDDLHEQLYAMATEPVIIYRTIPTLPVELEALAGTVKLEVTVLPDSTIGYIEVKESIPGLDSLAIKAVEQWEFMPSFREQEPVIGFVDVEVDFEIEEEDEPITEEEREEIERLREKIARFLEKEREVMKHRLLKLPLPTQSENYHLYSPYRPEPLIRKNNFTLLPAYTGAIQTFQTHYPFLRYDIKSHRWDLYSEDYPFEVALVDAYLGLGYLDMDYGHINLRKNNLFEIENLQINSGFITENGYWVGDDGETDAYLESKAREQRSDMMADLYYDKGNYSFRWSAYFINQKLPVAKFRHISDADTMHIDKKLSEHSLYMTNDYLDFGVRYEQLEYEAGDYNPERSLWQLSLNRPFNYRDHNISLQWESFFISEEDFSGQPYADEEREDFVGVSYNFDPKIMYLVIDVTSGLGYQYKAHSEAGYRFSEKFEMGLGYLETETDFDDHLFGPTQNLPFNNLFHQHVDSDIYAVLTCRNENRSISGSLKSRFGRQTISQHSQEVTEPESDLKYIETDSFYLSSSYDLTRRNGRVDLSLYGTANYYDNVADLWFMPDLFLRNTFSIRYRLEHNNIITLGLAHHHASEFDRGELKAESTDRLDVFLRLSLTDKFDIQGDAINLTESEHIYGIADRSGLHFNLGVRWFFFN